MNGCVRLGLTDCDFWKSRRGSIVEGTATSNASIEVDKYGSRSSSFGLLSASASDHLKRGYTGEITYGTA